MRRGLLLTLALAACADRAPASGPDSGDVQAASDASSDSGSPPDGGSVGDAAVDLPREDLPPSTCTTEVTVSRPAPDSTVAGLVDVVVDVADYACVDRVDLWVDGVLYATDDAARFTFLWDTATAHTNPLPAPTHPIDLAYYFVEWKGVDNTHEVDHYVNSEFLSATAQYNSDAEKPPLFRASLEAAVGRGNPVHLLLEDESNWEWVLDIAQDHWGSILRVEMADEPGWDQATTEGVLQRFRAELASRSLSDRPLGVVYTRTQLLEETSIFAAGLDWVGIEGYVDPPESSPDSAVNIGILESIVNQGLARVPADKDIVLVMMAYDRNGAWTNLQTLIDLQAPTYLLAHDDPRVVAINMFSYTRAGGSHDHPELRVVHKQIAERLFGIAVPELSNGAHALEIRAYNGVGDVTSVPLSVTVAN